MGNGNVKRSEESITLMTAYRFSCHGYRSFTFVQDDTLPYTVILNGAKILCKKDGKQNSGTKWRIYYADDVLPIFTPWQRILCWCSGWCLTVPRYSERQEECFVRKQENGNVKRSEESITPMTFYRLAHHGNRSFASIRGCFTIGGKWIANIRTWLIDGSLRFNDSCLTHNFMKKL